VARDINRDVVLKLIRTKEPVSRADLSRISGLQPSTISSIAEQLLSLNPDMVIIVADKQRAIRSTVEYRQTLKTGHSMRRYEHPMIASLPTFLFSVSHG